MAHTLSKGLFAARCGVTPGRVSQWIAEGKITREALDGEGRRARIIVPIALEQLRRNLDIGQRFGNGLATDLGDQAESAGTADRSPTLADELLREKLVLARFNARKREEEQQARRGFYMRTADVKAQVVAAVDIAVGLIEAGAPELATEIASRFELPEGDVLALVRLSMQKVRRSAAEGAHRVAAELSAEG